MAEHNESKFELELSEHRAKEQVGPEGVPQVVVVRDEQFLLTDAVRRFCSALDTARGVPSCCDRIRVHQP